MLGVTLVELMIALAILAILGVLSYRAVSAAADRQLQLAREFQRWRDITRFMHMTESDVFQVAARPAGAKSVPPSIVIARTTDGLQSRLSLLMLDGTSGSVRRRGYWPDNGRIVLLRWFDIEPGSEPQRDTVLEGVTALRVSALGVDGQRSDIWPPGGTTANMALPAAIELELELPDVGTLRRLYAIR
jgi:general secretion pathway protein J